jgi:hypothetical protein
MKFKGMISGKIGGAAFLSLIEESELESIDFFGCCVALLAVKF